MKINKAKFPGTRLSVLVLLFILFVSITTPAFAQGPYSSQVIDIRSPLSQDILGVLNQNCPNYRLVDLEGMTRNIQLAAGSYSLQPNTLLALMAGEDVYAGYPQARLYYFNLDTNLSARQEDFPPAWVDSERVARAYYSEYERYEDRTASVAAYFLGSQALPPSGDISNLSQEMKDLVGFVLRKDAEWSHLGERNAPQIVQTTEDTPADAAEPIVTYDFTAIEQAYIDNMIYFNPNLDENTAQEIFDAIRRHSNEYQAVDARLVMALVACESNFHPNAVSRCGAQGLGQLMPSTADSFGIDDPFSIDGNIQGTFAYLAREIDRWEGFDHPLDRILAAYNAGPGAVEQYSDAPYYGIPPYEETVNYVSKVINIYYYLLPEEERGTYLGGQSRHIVQENGTIRLAS
jgi:hypothetical protein